MGSAVCGHVQAIFFLLLKGAQLPNIPVHKNPDSSYNILNSQKHPVLVYIVIVLKPFLPILIFSFFQIYTLRLFFGDDFT